MQNHPDSHFLLYCRPGFERDCAEEVLRHAPRGKVIEAAENSGFVRMQGINRLDYAALIFARQVIRELGCIDDLPERDRLTPILDALPAQPERFGVLWLETPDTNAGKELSGFARRFGPLLESALQNAGRLTEADTLPRLHLFFPNRQRVVIGVSEPGKSAAWPMGILRQKMPPEAPSRSTLKLAEAFEVLLGHDQTRLLRAGMTAVDLGAAPGGWTWQLVRRGIKVYAIDNGPMKGAVLGHPLVEHLRVDGFRFRPRRQVDWLVCDMVERPQRVAALMADWIINGTAQHAIFNLKLPMKKRTETVYTALSDLRRQLDDAGVRYRLNARQLYHDREEITVYLGRSGGSRKK
jgi:23S rRNA (cytidine2498-2'-O)-methyltransferase